MPYKVRYNKSIKGNKKKIKQWNKVYESCRKQGYDSARCIRMANGVVKK